MAVPNTTVGLQITRIDGTHVNILCYKGPDDTNAAAAYLACKEIRDELERQRADKVHGVNIGPCLPWQNPSPPPV